MKLTEKQKKLLFWGGIAVLGYLIIRPSFKLMTSSPKRLKIAMSCAENEELVKSEIGEEYKCVPKGGELPQSQPYTLEGTLESVQINTMI